MDSNANHNPSRFSVVKTTIFFAIAFFIIISIIGYWKLEIGNSSKASAAFNQQINYQGKLTDADGVGQPDGNYSMTFRLYTDPSTTTYLGWRRRRPWSGNRFKKCAIFRDAWLLQYFRP